MAEPGKRRLGAVGYSADVLGFSTSVFVLLRDLIATNAGVYFADDKRDQLADKLSDKVQVIIASPPADGGFIGANLIGTPKRTAEK